MKTANLNLNLAQTYLLLDAIRTLRHHDGEKPLSHADVDRLDNLRDAVADLQDRLMPQ